MANHLQVHPIGDQAEETNHGVLQVSAIPRHGNRLIVGVSKVGDIDAVRN